MIAFERRLVYVKKEELERFIFLLTKYKSNADEITWGEMNELKSFSYQYGDFIEEEWNKW
jgi:hypothetical protein